MHLILPDFRNSSGIPLNPDDLHFQTKPVSDEGLNKKTVKMLRITEDPHLWIDIKGQRFATGKMKLVGNNYGSKQLSSLLQDKKVSNGFISVAGVIDSVGYISINEWNTDFNKLTFKLWGDSNNPEIKSEDLLKELFRYPNLIIDVRANSGGK